jgi:hypothetical protein
MHYTSWVYPCYALDRDRAWLLFPKLQSIIAIFTKPLVFLLITNLDDDVAVPLPIYRYVVVQAQKVYRGWT